VKSLLTLTLLAVVLTFLLRQALRGPGRFSEPRPPACSRSPGPFPTLTLLYSISNHFFDAIVRLYEGGARALVLPGNVAASVWTCFSRVSNSNSALSDSHSAYFDGRRKSDGVYARRQRDDERSKETAPSFLILRRRLPTFSHRCSSVRSVGGAG
jgi:hypothetical protein